MLIAHEYRARKGLPEFSTENGDGDICSCKTATVVGTKGKLQSDKQHSI